MTYQGPNQPSRRAFLGGGSAVVALPFLESLLPRAARAQAAAAPQRLVFWFVPNGINGSTANAWKPVAAGANYVTTPILMPLEPHRADFQVVTGLENILGKPDGPGDHAAGTASTITCAHATKSLTTIQLGISADQVAAKAFGMQTRLPSLQLGTAGGAATGDCDNGYSCAYARNISWSGPNTPLPKITDPATVFDQIFKGFTPGQSETDAAKRRALNKSVLDQVTAEANSLKLKLGRTDSRKVQEYLDGVRGLEQQIDGMATGAQCVMGTRPVKPAGSDFEPTVRLMCDLMVLAMQCDATRIISFMIGNAASGQTFPSLGITDGHHNISHHGNNATKLAQLEKIGNWEMQQFGYLLTKMKAVSEGSTNMLYNSAVFLSSDVSDGNSHSHTDMPVLLAGHAGGKLPTGRHLAYAPTAKQKVSNLLVSMLSAVGVPSPVVGDSSGPLPELSA
ncbi:MAG: DUF1552 domain-containing protein [Bacteroidota bacterium]